MPSTAGVSFYDEEYHTAVKLLNRFLKARDRASSEVRSFFISKGYSPESANSLVEKCRERGLIDDKRFLENFIHSYREKSYGRLYIEKKLTELGMDESEFSEYLGSIPKEEWIDSCEVYARKVFSGVLDSKQKLKASVQKLFSRGYEENTIHSVCKIMGLNIEFWDD